MAHWYKLQDRLDYMFISWTPVKNWTFTIVFYIIYTHKLYMHNSFIYHSRNAVTFTNSTPIHKTCQLSLIHVLLMSIKSCMYEQVTFWLCTNKLSNINLHVKPCSLCIITYLPYQEKYLIEQIKDFTQSIWTVLFFVLLHMFWKCSYLKNISKIKTLYLYHKWLYL